MGHEHEEPVVQRFEEPMVHRKEATERLSEKNESRGQSPDPKNREAGAEKDGSIRLPGSPNISL